MTLGPREMEQIGATNHEITKFFSPRFIGSGLIWKTSTSSSLREKTGLDSSGEFGKWHVWQVEEWIKLKRERLKGRTWMFENAKINNEITWHRNGWKWGIMPQHINVP
jgi:hypothetical protein